ncbi:MAG: hypothetical protein LBL75_02495 [Rickettsiales bacterium]|jgi:hypothetical protein|nr:hypothetical protein [Rickettsiales bacterium]
MIKNWKKLFIVCTLVGVCFCVPAFAEETDPFIINAALGADAALPNATISTAKEIEFNTTPLMLNGGASFYDVTDFDIAGVYVGMPFEDVQTLFFENASLYEPREKNSITYTMTTEWRYNLDYECREQGIIIPDELEKCILSAARTQGLLYPSELHLVRTETGETIDLYFTSNATDNVVWRVVYQNDVNELPGDAEKFAAQRDNKIMVFWQGVVEKFGNPNSGNDKWISSDNAFDPMMTAYYGMLDLVNQGLAAADATKNINDARENFRAKPYAF